MNPDTTPTPTPTWKVCNAFNSALLEDEKEGETINEILCASTDEAECLVDLLNGKEREVARLKEENARLRMKVETAADWMEYMGRSKSAATLRSELAPSPLNQKTK